MKNPKKINNKSINMYRSKKMCNCIKNCKFNDFTHNSLLCSHRIHRKPNIGRYVLNDRPILPETIHINPIAVHFEFSEISPVVIRWWWGKAFMYETWFDLKIDADWSCRMNWPISFWSHHVAPYLRHGRGQECPAIFVSLPSRPECFVHCNCIVYHHKLVNLIKSIMW